MIPCRNMIVSLILFDFIDLIHLDISSFHVHIFLTTSSTFLRTIYCTIFALGLLNVQSHISL